MIAGIKFAETAQNYLRCLHFLKERNVRPLNNTNLFYIEDNNKIKAVAGWHSDLGGTIEPLVSDSAGYTKTLGVFMFGLIVGKGFTNVSCWTSNQHWKDILIESGFTVCDESAARLVKPIYTGGK